MLENLFWLDKLVIKVTISYFSDPVNMISSLCGALIATNVYCTKNNKKGGK